MKTIRITGTMYEANTVPISKDETRQLLARLDSMEQPLYDMISLQDRLFSDSLVSGYLEDAGQVTVTISEDGGKASFTLQPKETISTFTVAQSHTDVVVTEKVTRNAEVVLEIDGVFQKDRLTWIAEELVLPSKECRVVMMPQYDGQAFEFVHSYTDSVVTYLLTAAGERIDLQTARFAENI